MNIESWQSQVWDCPNINPTAVAICLALGSHGHWSEEKTVWVSRTKIAKMVGASRDTVGKYLAALEDQGWLEVVRVMKNNVREYRMCKPQVAVVYGILAVKQRGKSISQVAVSNDNLDTTGENQVVVDNGQDVVEYGKQVVVDNGQVVVEYGKNLPLTSQENLPGELSRVETEGKELGKQVVQINRVQQFDSFLAGVSNLSLTQEQRTQIRELCLNPHWLTSEPRPNFRTQAAIKEILGNV